MSNNIKNPPALSNVYSQPQVSSTGNAQKAQQLGQTIQTFYNDTFTKDFKAVQTDKQYGRDSSQSEVSLAADTASLHNLESQFAQASGASADELKKWSDSPDHTTEGSTNEILAAAGSTRTQSDFTYTGSGSADGSTQNVRVNLKGSSAQAEANFAGGDNGTTVTTGSGGAGGANFSQINGSGSVQGGAYDPAAGKSAFQQLVQGQSLAELTPHQRADAFTYQQSLSPADQKAASSQSAGAQKLASYNNIAAGGQGGQASSDTDTYNRALTFFSNQVG